MIALKLLLQVALHLGLILFMAYKNQSNQEKQLLEKYVKIIFNYYPRYEMSASNINNYNLITQE